MVRACLVVGGAREGAKIWREEERVGETDTHTHPPTHPPTHARAQIHRYTRLQMLSVPATDLLPVENAGEKAVQEPGPPSTM